MIWEYKTTISEIRTSVLDVNGQKGFDVNETEQMLALLGKERWELVGVNPIIINGNTAQIAYFFKRSIIIKPSNLPEIGYDIDQNGITGSQR
jgi:hypothetical protein